nr:MAG TPA: hypothetical protein [Caudoviricetes sp.]
MSLAQLIKRQYTFYLAKMLLEQLKIFKFLPLKD